MIFICSVTQKVLKPLDHHKSQATNIFNSNIHLKQLEYIFNTGLAMAASIFLFGEVLQNLIFNRGDSSLSQSVLSSGNATVFYNHVNMESV